MLEYGTIRTAKIYRKVCKPEHYMVKFQGYGISYSEIERMAELATEFIEIVYKGKNGIRVYLSHFTQWVRSDKKYIDRSSGKDDLQVFLSENEMLKIVG